MEKLGVGIVGPGWVAGEHVKAYLRNPHTKVVAICGRDEAKTREAVKKRLGETVRSRSAIRPIHPHVLCAEIAGFLDPSATVIFDSYTGSPHLTDKLEARFAGQVLDAGLH